MDKKRIFMVLIAIFFSIFLTVENIAAVEQKQGTINVYLEQSARKVDIANVEFELIKVGEVIDGKYIFVEELKHISLDLNNLRSGEELQNGANMLSNAVMKKRISGIRKKTNTAGVIRYGELEIGVYLLRAVDINEYDNVSPSIVAVPTFGDSLKNNNSMNYNIDIVPKHSSITAAKTGDDVRINESLFFIVVTIIFIIISLKRESLECWDK